MLNVVKDVGQLGNHEIILIGNREIKWQRICHDVKTANFNSHKFKWGYRMPSSFDTPFLKPTYQILNPPFLPQHDIVNLHFRIKDFDPHFHRILIC